MFKKGMLFVHIGSNDIRLLVGNKRKIIFAQSISTVESNLSNYTIFNVKYVASKIKDVLNINDIKAKKISFAIDGQDVVVRHIEIPIIKKEGLENAVKWETNQQLPNVGENYYVDFQIIDRVTTKGKKMYKILVVAAPKEKINKYFDLAKELKVELSSIDISANCLARTFSFSVKKDNKNESVGIINLEKDSSSIVILDKGNLFFEREVDHGVNDIIKKLAEYKGIPVKEMELKFRKTFRFSNSDIIDEMQNSVQTYFDSILFSFDKVIQFYTSSRSKKTLDQIYLIGVGADIEGLEDYISSYFDTKVAVVNSPEDINIETITVQNFDLKLYTNTFGLMLRKDRVWAN